MAKTKTIYSCIECGYSTAKWLGQCPSCSSWNSLEEEKVHKTSTGVVKKEKAKPLKISEVEISLEAKYKTGISEFDRVLGDGVTKGSLVLIGGEPGIGKSTLLMDVCKKLADNPKLKILYVSGEESATQIAQRSKRLGISDSTFFIMNESSIQTIVETAKDFKPDYIIIDSIQTMSSDDVQSATGTVSQVREVTFELMNYCKGKGVTGFVVGHVTKEGSIAGPKVLEHMVDTVLYFEGDQFGQYRILRSIKNRFGNTNEVGIFEMFEDGLKEVPNPAQYFLETATEDSMGRSLSCIVEGTRPLMVEVQALVVENKFGNGRRTTQGLDSNRVAMLVAVVDKYFEIPLSYNDIYVNIVGGIKLKGRDCDLAIIASLLSSYYNRPLPEGTIFLGEVGLTGEVRSLPLVESRIKELAQLNYKKVVTSSKYVKLGQKYGIEVQGILKASELNKFFN